ncbi:MAG: flagellar motor switch protein FliN [Methylocystis sp.]|nr:flagellar motor switch protein FliN [Methylocystis sp.]
MNDSEFEQKSATEDEPIDRSPPDGANGPKEAVEEKASGRRIDSILRIPVTVQVVVGSATLPVATLLKLGRGAVIQLDHRVGDPVDIVVNGRIFARGEVVVVEEDGARFGVSLTEICSLQREDDDA